MIVPDINLLLYAYDAASPFHAKAAAWLEESLSGSEPVGLAEVVVFGFIRIATSARVFQKPLTPHEAAEYVRSWLAQPVIQILQGTETHVREVVAMIEKIGTAGNMMTDAQIAALAMEHEATVHTADSDFLRFEGLRWFNPITGNSSTRLRRR